MINRILHSWSFHIFLQNSHFNYVRQRSGSYLEIIVLMLIFCVKYLFMKICTAPSDWCAREKEHQPTSSFGTSFDRIMPLCIFHIRILLLLNLAQIHVQGTCGVVRKEPYVYLHLQRYIVGVLF